MKRFIALCCLLLPFSAFGQIRVFNYEGETKTGDYNASVEETYNRLKDEVILKAVEEVGMIVTSKTESTSKITNTSYSVNEEERATIVKFGRPSLVYDKDKKDKIDSLIPIDGGLKVIAWYKGNSGKKTQPVGHKKPNELGIYDMSGNVWEWCSDLYGDYPSGSVSDPKGPVIGSHRVDRGGGWDNSAWRCRVAYRGSFSPSSCNNLSGFRVVFETE